jgi:type III restriction enzyme
MCGTCGRCTGARGGGGLKIRFDGDQQYQKDAVDAVLDVFEGQPAARGQFEVGLSAGFGGGMTELGFGNELSLDERAVLENARAVQARDDDIEPSEELRGMNFSVEMETGTGKTYVYLRTIHELYARYGFTKFIIVVPSVAIREGVLKNIQLTREHFRALYGNHPFDYWVYDSRRVSSVRQFATSNQLQIMVINIDAFNKKTNNVIHQENDRLSGYKPIEFIQQTSPVVVVDEPQNMESENAKSAIESLNPMCTLRYSATHRDPYNLLHRLTPVDAYEQRLVKRIEVDSVMDDPDFNRPFVRLDSVKATKTKVTAKLTIDVQGTGGPRRKTVTVDRGGVDLFDLSGEREPYRGYIVDEIDASGGSEHVDFSNGERLCEGESTGGHTDERMRVQVRETVREHLEKELRVQKLPGERRMKVLSLFFIDKVANYAGDEPKIRRWFEEAYEELSAKPAYAALGLPPLESVHNGYFAQDGKGNVKDTSGNTKADDEAYELIMRDKERLLSPEEPLRFVFSHSALREGWDNPNVFQICTLNESRSEIRKRQEIGRGLRLPVDVSGERCFDPDINKLTVIANESYEDFARGLQDEFQQDGVPFKRDMVKPVRERRTAKLKEGWRDDDNFKELWERIRRRARYSVDFDTEALISRASQAVSEEMPLIEPPKFRVQRGGVEIDRTGVSGHMTSGVREEQVDYGTPDIPDVLGYIQRETELTRGTIAGILARSGRLEELHENPQQFMDLATRHIREVLQRLMIDNIQYRLSESGEEDYLLYSFERERQMYESRMLKVNKSIYDAIEYESEVEQQFARDLDSREDVEVFLKLPDWFEIDTPVGGYVPDWAIVRRNGDGERMLHLVAETKSSLDPAKRRPRENDKITCGEAHFKELPEVVYKVATSASEV